CGICRMEIRRRSPLSLEPLKQGPPPGLRTSVPTSRKQSPATTQHKLWWKWRHDPTLWLAVKRQLNLRRRMETTDVTEAAEPQPKAGKDAFHRVPNISGANKRDAVERVLTENLR